VTVQQVTSHQTPFGASNLRFRLSRQVSAPKNRASASVAERKVPKLSPAPRRSSASPLLPPPELLSAGCFSAELQLRHLQAEYVRFHAPPHPSFTSSTTPPTHNVRTRSIQRWQPRRKQRRKPWWKRRQPRRRKQQQQFIPQQLQRFRNTTSEEGEHFGFEQVHGQGNSSQIQWW
jgi:hypothetical protein